MLKKILIALVLVIGLQAMPAASLVEVPLVYAEENPPAPDEPEPGDIDSPSFMFDLSSVTHEAIEGTTRQGWIRQGINYFFERIIGFLATVIGSLAVLMLSVGGFLMLSSAGNETQYEKGRNYAKYALIGLGVTLMAYVMVSLVQLLIKSIYA
jgi:hypothetical protein